jgi:integrase
MGKRQFGTIRELKGGWQARYRDGDGRLVPGPHLFPTKGDAARFLSSVQTDMARGQFIDPREGKITLARWADEWLALPGKRPASVARDRQALGVFITPLGAMPLSALTPKHIQAVVNDRCRTTAPATVKRDVAALRAVLNAAVDADRLARSPARKIALPAVRSLDRATLTPEGIALLIDELPSIYQAVVLTAAVLGLRWGETIGLRIRDIDFLHRKVTVAQTVKELGGHLSIEPEGKTSLSMRTLAVPPFLADALSIHIAAHRGGPPADSDELVFLGPRGGVLRRRFCERILRSAVERIRTKDADDGRECPVPSGLTFHGLRHIGVTAMADAGVSWNVTRSRAGHTTARPTMEIYGHRSPEADRGAADLLQAYFRPVISCWGSRDVGPWAANPSD